jgi:hypothetical protein
MAYDFVLFCFETVKRYKNEKLFLINETQHFKNKTCAYLSLSKNVFIWVGQNSLLTSVNRNVQKKYL